MELGRVARRRRSGDASLSEPARRREHRPLRDDQNAGFSGRAERSVEPGDTAADDDEVVSSVSFRLTVENLAALYPCRAGRRPAVARPGPQTLLWQRARDPEAGAWSLPGGYLGPRRRSSVDPAPPGREGRRARALASRAARRPGATRAGIPTSGSWPPRTSASFRRDADPAVPEDTAGIPSTPAGDGVRPRRDRPRGRERLRAKLSYTNLGFALAPPTFTISELRELYAAALGHEVSATNLQRVLLRRELLEDTAERRPPGPHGGRPADGLPLPVARARGHRPVRRAPTAGVIRSIDSSVNFDCLRQSRSADIAAFGLDGMCGLRIPSQAFGHPQGRNG